MVKLGPPTRTAPFGIYRGPPKRQHRPVDISSARSPIFSCSAAAHYGNFGSTARGEEYDRSLQLRYIFIFAGVIVPMIMALFFAYGAAMSNTRPRTRKPRPRRRIVSGRQYWHRPCKAAIAGLISGSSSGLRQLLGASPGEFHETGGM
jgi:hypothetical protein